MKKNPYEVCRKESALENMQVFTERAAPRRKICRFRYYIYTCFLHNFRIK